MSFGQQPFEQQTFDKKGGSTSLGQKTFGQNTFCQQGEVLPLCSIIIWSIGMSPHKCGLMNFGRKTFELLVFCQKESSCLLAKNQLVDRHQVKMGFQVFLSTTIWPTDISPTRAGATSIDQKPSGRHTFCQHRFVETCRPTVVTTSRPNVESAKCLSAK